MSHVESTCVEWNGRETRHADILAPKHAKSMVSQIMGGKTSVLEDSRRGEVLRGDA